MFQQLKFENWHVSERVFYHLPLEGVRLVVDRAPSLLCNDVSSLSLPDVFEQFAVPLHSFHHFPIAIEAGLQNLQNISSSQFKRKLQDCKKFLKGEHRIFEQCWAFVLMFHVLGLCDFNSIFKSPKIKSSNRDSNLIPDVGALVVHLGQQTDFDLVAILKWESIDLLLFHLRSFLEVDEWVGDLFFESFHNETSLVLAQGSG